MGGMDVETYTAPPEPDEDEDGDVPSARLGVHYLDVDEVHYDAGVQLFGADADDPEKFATAVLKAALAVAALAGPDYSWAVTQRLVAYDGTIGR